MRTLRVLSLLVFIAGGIAARAQAPSAFKYQAVMRDAESNPMPNRSLDIQINVYGTAPGNPLLYSETQSVVTNDVGLFALEVGRGASADPPDTLLSPMCCHSMEVLVDIDGTGVLTSMGTEEFLSVPYALHAAHSSNVPDGTEVGQVMHWDGGEWVADSGLYVVGKRFGIGTTQPGAPLGIEADSSGRAIRISSSENLGSNNNWDFSRVYFPGQGEFGGLLFSNVPNSGTAVPSFFLADSTGRVGIGTTAPISPLTVEADSTTGSALVLRRGVTASKAFVNWVALTAPASSPPGLLITDSLADPGRVFFIADSTGNVGLGTQDPPAALSIESRNVLKTYFQTGDTPTEDDFVFTATDSTGFGIEQGTPDALSSRLFIDGTTGNVGVGTTEPAARLTVRDEVAEGPVAFSLSNTASSTNCGWSLGHVADGGGSHDGYLALCEDLFPCIGDRDFNDATMVFRPGGNIGIGDTMPEAPLSIRSRNELYERFKNGDIPDQQDFVIGTTDNGGLNIGEDTTSGIASRLFIDAVSHGNVGIGTLTPDQKLHIQGINDGGVVGIHLLNTASVANDGWDIGHLQDPLAERDGALVFSEPVALTPGHGVGRMVILPGGNVGINEPMPNATLHVSRSAADPEAAIDLVEGTGIALFGPIDDDHLAFDSHQIQARAGSGGGGGGSVLLQPASLGLQPLGGAIRVHAATADPNDQVVITSDGKLGMGLSDPTDIVDVRTPWPDPYLAIRISNTACTVDQGWRLGHLHDPDPLRDGSFVISGVDNADENDLVIRNNGYLGVGRSPEEQLDVNGAIRLGNTTNDNEGTIRWTGSEFQGRTASNWVSFSSLVVGGNGVLSYTWSNTPRVGIGTTMPSATLHVEDSEPSTAGNTALVVHNQATTSSTGQDDHRVGLQVECTGIWGGDPASKNIGLYVSDVSGQQAAEQNIAALLNGNVVIGDATGQHIGTDGNNVLAIQNGTAPVTGPGITVPGGIQIFSDDVAPGGPSVFHLMNGDGSVIQLKQQNPLFVPNNAPLNPVYDASVVEIIDNMRTRINELEARLQALGLLP
ncbi:MAG: hypothetical protein H6597_06555 [Flavobacteriales bacterium]|nr:hypothetical protein [Flavobacteriales bacterium]